ncbi:hypothetical protein ACH4VR_36260 [Streptomyces sp. NPDC020883]|uniref:hypothetical protein n=1 Tax=Streptomyces sp. NPDC020883 TaxID=3365099 RepID=UPI00378D2828
MARPERGGAPTPDGEKRYAALLERLREFTQRCTVAALALDVEADALTGDSAAAIRAEAEAAWRAASQARATAEAAADLFARHHTLPAEVASVYAAVLDLPRTDTELAHALHRFEAAAAKQDLNQHRTTQPTWALFAALYAQLSAALIAAALQHMAGEIRHAALLRRLTQAEQQRAAYTVTPPHTRRPTPQTARDQAQHESLAHHTPPQHSEAPER